MIMKMFAVRDSKVEAFHTPYTFRTIEEAIRSFRQTCQEESTMFAKNPEDFSLWLIADFDEGNGEVTPNPLTCVVQAIDCVESSNG